VVVVPIKFITPPDDEMAFMLGVVTFIDKSPVIVFVPDVLIIILPPFETQLPFTETMPDVLIIPVLPTALIVPFSIKLPFDDILTAELENCDATVVILPLIVTVPVELILKQEFVDWFT